MFYSTEATRPASELPTLEIQYVSSGHTVTIQDNDTAEVAFAGAASSVGESAGSHTLNVQLTITGNGTPGTGTLERAVTVNVRDQLIGTTSHPADYTYGNPKTVTFAAGATSGAQSVAFAVHEDDQVEGHETDLFDLANLQDGTSGQVSLASPASTPSRSSTTTKQPFRSPWLRVRCRRRRPRSELT